MNIPKFKPTSWNIKYCVDCKGLSSYWCEKGRNNHNIIEKPNVPFFVPRMQILCQQWKGWWSLKSEFNGEEFSISPSNIEPIILEYGILPGGIIENKWWMYCKMGSMYSLKVLSDE